MIPDAGMVMIQANTMLFATFQRTADILRAAPTPMIEPVMVWVVDTGMPIQVAAKRVTPPPVAAQRPGTGVSRVIFDPMGFTMRQPPISVPRPSAAWQVITTQNGA